MDACGRAIRLPPLARDKPPSRVLAFTTLRVLEAGVPLLMVLISILILSKYEGRRLWSPPPLAPLAPVFTGVSKKKKKNITLIRYVGGCSSNLWNLSWVGGKEGDERRDGVNGLLVRTRTEREEKGVYSERRIHTYIITFILESQRNGRARTAAERLLQPSALSPSTPSSTTPARPDESIRA